MDIKRLFATVAITAAIISTVTPVDTCAQTNNALDKITNPFKKLKPKKSKDLKEENKRLQAEIDSLRQQLDDYIRQHEASDSLAEEIIEIYEENENRIGAGLSEGDYTPEVTDSLLNLWYKTRRSISEESSAYDMDMVHFTSSVPDSVYIRRLKKMNSYITLPYNETVRNYIILYSEKMPTGMGHMLGLARHYFPIFEETLNKYDMPEELKYMAVIESALNPIAVSRANAKGMWQFMYSTAKNYGLKINSYVDERLDPVKAADAAARYLRDAYRIFGDWNLAISAYNCGAGNVNKAIRRAGGNKDFWTIYEYLPRETRGYVPAFVGAMYAFTYYKEHGIVPEQIDIPAHLDTFAIKRNLHFGQVHGVIDVPVELLKELNPQYMHDIVPGNEGVSFLTLPSQYTSAFIDNEDSIYNYQADKFLSPKTLEDIKRARTEESGRIVYKVRKGDYLGKIAARHHVTVAQIKRWNNLRNNNIRVGQRLVIHRR